MKRYIQATPDSVTDSGIQHIYSNRVHGAIIRLRLPDTSWDFSGTKFTVIRADGAMIVITCVKHNARIQKEGSGATIDVPITSNANTDIRNIVNAILNI